MSDSDVEFSPPVGRIIKRKNLGVVETKKSSKTLKAASLALAALGTIGAGRAIATDIGNTIDGGDNADNGVSVTIVPHQSLVEAEAMQHNSNEFFDTIFHDLSPEQKEQARQKVDGFKEDLASNKDIANAYQDIVVRYGPLIEQASKKYGISKESFFGLALIESNGDTNVVNESSGSAGLFQFLEKTARDMNLTVDLPHHNDQRLIPAKSIDAAGWYLKINEDLFAGDEGMADWSINAGAGNVMNALRLYFIDVAGVDIGDYGEAVSNGKPGDVEKIVDKVHKLKTDYKVDMSKLIANKKAWAFISQLKENTWDYTYKVVAGAELLDEQKDKSVDLGSGLKVAVANKPSSSPLPK